MPKGPNTERNVDRDAVKCSFRTRLSRLSGSRGGARFSDELGKWCVDDMACWEPVHVGLIPGPAMKSVPRHRHWLALNPSLTLLIIKEGPFYQRQSGNRCWEAKSISGMTHFVRRAGMSHLDEINQSVSQWNKEGLRHCAHQTAIYGVSEWRHPIPASAARSPGYRTTRHTTLLGVGDVKWLLLLLLLRSDVTGNDKSLLSRIVDKYLYTMLYMNVVRVKLAIFSRPWTATWSRKTNIYTLNLQPVREFFSLSISSFLLLGRARLARWVWCFLITADSLTLRNL